VFDRADGYLGVMIDDPHPRITEPYRMFTSRRIIADLAGRQRDQRLTDKGSRWAA